MKEKINQLSFENQDIYIGLDTHLKSWKVTIMLSHSDLKTFSMNPDAKELGAYLRKNFPNGNYYSAYEASFCGFHIHQKLLSQGIQNIVVNPADVPTTDKERKQKEDKRDSRKIARSLRSGELTGIYIPSEEHLEFRSLVRYRKTLTKEISRNKHRIKSLLYFSGIEIPPSLATESKYWSGKFTQWLKTVEMKTSQGNFVLINLLEVTLYLRKNLLNANRQIRNANKSGKYSKMLQLLQSIPGIGLIVAATIISELEAINRFKKLDTLCSYIGLVPKTSSSGESEKTGNITPRANRALRSMLIESAWTAIRIDPSMAYSYNNLCNRMKKNEAIIRITKKLLNRIRFVMKNETEYVYSTI